MATPAHTPKSPKIDLAAHIAMLRKRDKQSKPKNSQGITDSDAILFWGTSQDKDYLHQLRSCVGATTTFIRLEKVDTLTQVQLYCAKKGITRIISSSPSLLAKALHWTERAAPKLSSYAGSLVKIPSYSSLDSDIEVVFLAPLRQLITVPYAKFIAERLISKLTAPDSWYKATAFSWELLTPENEESHFHSFSRSMLVAIDIETFKTNATIRCLSYTAFFHVPEQQTFISETVVLPLDSEYALAIMRKWNWKLQAPKVFQNGKYDLSYLARYTAPVYNYLYDTANMFHSYLSELPKDLGFLNAFFIREAMYWKDLAHTHDLYEYYRYNALDTWATGNALLAMVLELPAYAEKNYIAEFPLVFPCHMCEMRGIERDMEVLATARAEADKTVATLSLSLDKILGVKGFNVKSPPQMKQLLTILGCSDLKSADEKSLKKARFRHPFNARVLKLVLDIREARTLREKYLQTGEKAKEFHAGIPEMEESEVHGNRILFALNPHGTDSSRLAAREHHFWCGLQIHNIPRGPGAKQTLRADPGFYLAEADLEQAESRDTAYISGDETLIHNVEYSPDFHSANAAAFFGVAFEAIYDVATGKVLDKPLRQLAKPVNHGANYNMGEFILIETMGEENIVKAKQLLGLNRFWGYREVARYLLERFHTTYPGIKKVFYAGVVEEIAKTGMLVHHTLPEPGLTRRCFGNPEKSKQSLNSYIAHPPQSLNAQTLNKAFMKVFFNIAIHPDHADNFKLIAQIHDSILFQYRIGHEYLCDMVKDMMEIPVRIQAYDGVIREFTVPAGVKAGKNGKPAIYWSETE